MATPIAKRDGDGFPLFPGGTAGEQPSSFAGSSSTDTASGSNSATFGRTSRSTLNEQVAKLSEIVERTSSEAAGQVLRANLEKFLFEENTDTHLFSVLRAGIQHAPANVREDLRRDGAVLDVIFLEGANNTLFITKVLQAASLDDLYSYLPKNVTDALVAKCVKEAPEDVHMADAAPSATATASSSIHGTPSTGVQATPKVPPRLLKSELSPEEFAQMKRELDVEDEKYTRRLAELIANQSLNPDFSKNKDTLRNGHGTRRSRIYRTYNVDGHSSKNVEAARAVATIAPEKTLNGATKAKASPVALDTTAQAKTKTGTTTGTATQVRAARSGNKAKKVSEKVAAPRGETPLQTHEGHTSGVGLSPAMVKWAAIQQLAQRKKRKTPGDGPDEEHDENWATKKVSTSQVKINTKSDKN